MPKGFSPKPGGVWSRSSFDNGAFQSPRDSFPRMPFHFIRAIVGKIVEVDETFVGGLAKNRHIDKRGKGGGTGGIGFGKTPVVGAVKRKGNVTARVIKNG